MRNAKQDIDELLTLIDRRVNELSGAAAPLQKKAYEYLRDELLKFEMEEGRFVPKQDLRKRLIKIEKELNSIVSAKVWSDSVDEFLTVLPEIQDNNVRMQAEYSKIDVDSRIITPARLLLYEKAKQALIKGLAEAYVQPAKFLLMRMVTSGSSIHDALKLLERWDKGELSKGKYTNGTMTPDLQKYATQLARDTAYSVDRTISSIIEEKYQLKHFVYAGGLLADSRPLCRHLVAMNGPIPFEALPELIRAYPDGLIAGTTKDNFTQVCGGYNCIHKALPVRVIEGT